MKRPSKEAYAIWQTSQAWIATEWCQLVEGSGGITLSGCAVGAMATMPTRIDYSIACDVSWRTRTVDIHRQEGGRETYLSLVCENGRWNVQGLPAPDLEGAFDIDLGFSPSTNTLPIRRLNLSVGESADIQAVWIRFPEFDIVKARQTYTRTADQTYQYVSNDFAADILVDEAGLVTSYAEWVRIGAS